MIKAELEKKEGKRRRTVPKELIYEMRNGSPIYYRNYDKVLSGEKSLEEVMGISKIQSIVIFCLLEILYKNLNLDKYIILTNEVGFQYSKKSWRNLDIGIFDKRKLLEDPVKDKYTTIPPEVVIEIDTKADLRKFSSPQEYFHRKTQDLLDSGVKKVIWIFTKERKIWLAEKGKRWTITDWNNTIEIIDNIRLNLDTELSSLL
ncbi:MAG: Uma2 family endonuclease [Hydrogenothermaceae bacterium]|nr:Uma2 family endonuclease [Hydrogenothermaceae bacterium]